MLTVPFTEAERQRLASFRRAALQVRDASIIDTGQTIEVRVRPGDPGYADLFVKFLDEEPFRSLATSFRLIYMQREPAHFFSICNLVAREGDEAVRERVANLRRQWNETLDNRVDRLGVVSDAGESIAFSQRDMLDHWLNGIVFHQDADRQEPLRQLDTAGYQFRWNVQSTVLQLAGRILDLDDVVAEVLNEPQVPRIEARQDQPPLTDPLFSLHPDVWEVSRVIYEAIRAAGRSSPRFDAAFYERFATVLAMLEARGLVEGKHTFGARFGGGIVLSASFIIYMAGLYEDPQRMLALNELIDRSPVGRWLQGDQVAETLGLPFATVRAVFRNQTSNGLGIMSNESGTANYRRKV